MLKKHSSFVRVLAIVTLMLSVIGGIVLAVELEHAWIFFVVLVCAGIQFALLLTYSALLAAVGDTEETVWEIHQNTKKLQQQIESDLSKPVAQEIQKDRPLNAPNEQPAEGTPVFTEPTKKATISCPNCGQKQSADRAFCMKCGASFGSSK